MPIPKHYPEYAKQHVEIPFSIAYEMRNSLAHGYFKVDYELVWTTIERDLPEFQAGIKLLLSEVG